MAGDDLGEKVAKMREALQKSQCITDNMVFMLECTHRRLSSLQIAMPMPPTQIRTHATRTAHENIDKTLKISDIIVGRFDLFHEAEAKILGVPHGDLENYFEAIKQLRSTIDFFTNNESFKSSKEVISRATDLLSKAISELTQEFELSSNSKAPEPHRLHEWLRNWQQPSSVSLDASSNTHIGHITAENADFTPLILITPEVLLSLHDLVKQMVQSGHMQQCLDIYRDIRSAVLEGTLQKLGLEKFTKHNLQKMQWEVFEQKIWIWIDSMHIAVKLLFAEERMVCDQVFEGNESLKDQCFAEVTAGSVAMLLSFGDAIDERKRSSEMLFVLLDIYGTMGELQSEIESLFRGKACKGIRKSALGLMKRLAKTAQKTLGDFEEAVEKDATRTDVSDGRIHPLTSYVIDYVITLFDHQLTLKKLFQELEAEDSNSQLTSATKRILHALRINLEGKSKQHEDPALANLFLMNNNYYMYLSLMSSGMKDLLGDDWMEGHIKVVRRHATLYKMIDWTKILQCLCILDETTSEGLSSVWGDHKSVQELIDDGAKRYDDNAPTVCAGDRLERFSELLEELHKKQSQWTVPDTKLQEDLRRALTNVLLVAYRSFFRRYSYRNPDEVQEYTRYTAEIKQKLGKVFKGKP